MEHVILNPRSGEIIVTCDRDLSTAAVMSIAPDGGDVATLLNQTECLDALRLAADWDRQRLFVVCSDRVLLVQPGEPHQQLPLPLAQYGAANDVYFDEGNEQLYVGLDHAVVRYNVSSGSSFVFPRRPSQEQQQEQRLAESGRETHANQTVSFDSCLHFVRNDSSQTWFAACDTVGVIAFDERAQSFATMLDERACDNPVAMLLKKNQLFVASVERMGKHERGEGQERGGKAGE